MEQWSASSPQDLSWRRDGMKYLSIFLGNGTITKKNWGNIMTKIEGKINKWKWLLPQTLYKRTTLWQLCGLNAVTSINLLGRAFSSDPGKSCWFFFLGWFALGATRGAVSAKRGGGRGAGHHFFLLGNKVLQLWRERLSGRERSLPVDYSWGAELDNSDPFPKVNISPQFDGLDSPLLKNSRTMQYEMQAGIQLLQNKSWLQRHLRLQHFLRSRWRQITLCTFSSSMTTLMMYPFMYLFVELFFLFCWILGKSVFI